MPNEATRNFARGYFCAVKAMLADEGVVTPIIQELFKAGGDPTCADPEDQTAFIEFGLMPDPFR